MLGHVIPAGLGERARCAFAALPSPAQAAAALAVVVGISRVAGSTAAPFIYFQF